jgi:hypothetical protein
MYLSIATSFLFKQFIFFYTINCNVLPPQNGTVVIENPDMLKATANGHVSSKSSEASKAKLIVKGPTDKQVTHFKNA